MKTGAWFFVLFLLSVLSGCWGSADATNELSKKDAFREVLGFAPPASVTDIRSHYYYMRDSYIRWLQFKCDADTFAKIEKEAGLTAAKGSNPQWAPAFTDRRKNPNAPDWWWDVGEKTKFEEFEREVSKDHVSDRAHVWVDPATGISFRIARCYRLRKPAHSFLVSDQLR